MLKTYVKPTITFVEKKNYKKPEVLATTASVKSLDNHNCKFCSSSCSTK